MLTSGKISYEIGGKVEATPFGGLFAMHRLVTKLGLVKAIDASLHLLKLHLPYHESDHVLTLAYSVLCGGARLEDVDRLRNDVPLLNGLGARLLPDRTTTGTSRQHPGVLLVARRWRCRRRAHGRRGGPSASGTARWPARTRRRAR